MNDDFALHLPGAHLVLGMTDDQNQDWTPGESRLRLKSRKVEEEIRIPPPPPQKKGGKKKSKEPGQASGRFGIRFLSMSIGSFLLAMMVFGSFLYHQVQHLDILTPQQAAMTRGITVVSFFVILVIEAFSEDMIQGVLSLFLPPYAFVYGLLFADAGPIRGLTMAMLVFLSAEVYFTPNDALVPKTFTAINEWIEAGQQKLINPEKMEAGFSK